MYTLWAFACASEEGGSHPQALGEQTLSTHDDDTGLDNLKFYLTSTRCTVCRKIRNSPCVEQIRKQNPLRCVCFVLDFGISTGSRAKSTTGVRVLVL